MSKFKNWLWKNFLPMSYDGYMIGEAMREEKEKEKQISLFQFSSISCRICLIKSFDPRNVD